MAQVYCSPSRFTRVLQILTTPKNSQFSFVSKLKPSLTWDESYLIWQRQDLIFSTSPFGATSLWVPCKVCWKPGEVRAWLFSLAGMDDEQCLSKETKVQTSSQCEMPKNTVGELMSVEDPKNWPLSKKVYINTVLMMIVFLQTYASGVYSPGISAMLHDINTVSYTHLWWREGGV